LISEISMQSSAPPASDVLRAISPIIKDAVIEVFQQKGDPNSIAEKTAEQINQAQNK